MEVSAHILEIDHDIPINVATKPLQSHMQHIPAHGWGSPHGKLNLVGMNATQRRQRGFETRQESVARIGQRKVYRRYPSSRC
jgi:hypothetical protein